MTAAAAQIKVVPLPLRALAVESLSAPVRLPLLLDHLVAASASHDSNGAMVSVRAPAGTTAPFPICLAHLLGRGVLLGWGQGGHLQLRLPEGGERTREGTAAGVAGAGIFVESQPALEVDSGAATAPPGPGNPRGRGPPTWRGPRTS